MKLRWMLPFINEFLQGVAMQAAGFVHPQVAEAQTHKRLSAWVSGRRVVGTERRLFVPSSCDRSDITKDQLVPLDICA